MRALRLVLLLGLMWVSRDFHTMAALVTFLNGLPESRQIEAKIIVMPSNRAVFGWADSPYTLVYRVER